MGLSQHRFLVHKQKGGSAYQRKPLGLDSITVAQGDFSCSPRPMWAFPQACENPWPQCRQACRQLAPGSQDVQGRMLLRSSLGPRRGVYERSGGNGERGPRPGAVSAVLSRWGLVLTFSSPPKAPQKPEWKQPISREFPKTPCFWWALWASDLVLGVLCGADNPRGREGGSDGVVPPCSRGVVISQGLISFTLPAAHTLIAWISQAVNRGQRRTKSEKHQSSLSREAHITIK